MSFKAASMADLDACGRSHVLVDGHLISAEQYADQVAECYHQNRQELGLPPVE